MIRSGLVWRLSVVLALAGRVGRRMHTPRSLGSSLRAATRIVTNSTRRVRAHFVVRIFPGSLRRLPIDAGILCWSTCCSAVMALRFGITRSASALAGMRESNGRGVEQNGEDAAFERAHGCGEPPAAKRGYSTPVRLDLFW